MANTTNTKKTPTVVGVFRTRTSADACFNALLDRGYAVGDVNVMMSDSTRAREYHWDDKAKGTKAGSLATEGMGVGGAIGTAVGATIAAIAAVGTSIMLPGLGLIVAGPLAAALAGGGAGAVTGGLVGALVGAGIPEQNADVYNKALADGGVVMSVAAKDSTEAAEVEKLMTSYSGEQVCRC